MTALAFSLAALLSAPLLDGPLRRHPRAAAGIDAFTTVLVGGIVIAQVLPYCVGVVGWPAVVAALAGALLPVVTHRTPGGRGVVAVLAGAALAIHGMLDGAMLAVPDDHGPAEHLAHAVILHSLPVGLGVWRAVAPERGKAAAMLLLGTSALGTVGGFLFAPSVLASASGALAVAQALAAGSLVHLVGHGGSRRDPVGAGIGGAVGLLGVVVLLVTDPH